MAKVPLDTKQIELKDNLIDLLSKAKRWNEYTSADIANIFQEMSKVAHELHMSLTPKPKHHRYMIENRGLKPEHPDFYKHIHPVEDLLAYLNDDTANNDPQDQTIGCSFKFRVYSRRWGHDDIYNLTRNGDGWFVKFISREGQCDKQGHPVLYNILDNDGINYPMELPGYLEWLWNRAQDQGLSKDEVQKALDQLAEWVSVCERNSPKGIFEGYR